MLKIFTYSVFLPLVSFLGVLSSINLSLAESADRATDIKPQSQARARSIDKNVLEILENWVQGSHAFEEGDVPTAREQFKSNINRIEEIEAREERQCFLSFNTVLLQSTTESRSPDFLSVEPYCFDRIILLLSNYSASQ